MKSYRKSTLFPGTKCILEKIFKELIKKSTVAKKVAVKMKGKSQKPLKFQQKLYNSFCYSPTKFLYKSNMRNRISFLFSFSMDLLWVLLQEADNVHKLYSLLSVLFNTCSILIYIFLKKCLHGVCIHWTNDSLSGMRSFDLLNSLNRAL